MRTFCVDKKLDRAVLRAIVTLVFAATAAALGYAATANFIASSLADPRKEIDRDALELASKYLPRASGLQARLAEAYMIAAEPDLTTAEAHARNAVDLSPFNYSFRQQLALVQEMRGDRASAELSLRAAVGLAPNNLESHWRLGNLLVRAGKISESFDEFRRVAGSDKNRFNSAIDLVWRASGGSVAAVETITPDAPESKLALARFLLNQSKFDDAIRVVETSGEPAELPRGEVASVTNALTGAGLYERARTLWCGSLGASADRPIIWNGGFESSIDKNFNQFDWSLSSSEFARTTIDQRAGHSGSRSLRIDFAGRDTTRLGAEVRQLVLLQPGKSYTLECWVKTQALVAAEGPQIVLTDNRNSAVVAATDRIAEGSNDWKRIFVKFSLPLPPRGITTPYAVFYVGLKRDPRYSYDEPMRGTLWLDDFEVKEAGGQ